MFLSKADLSYLEHHVELKYLLHHVVHRLNPQK